MTRKPIRFSIILAVIAALVFVNSVAAKREVRLAKIPTADIAGSKDNPNLKRYAGSFIIAHQFKKYDEFTYPLSKLEGKRPPYAPKEKKTVEGPYTRLVYMMPADRSPLEIIRNYQDEIEGQGGNVLYKCKREECGGDDEPPGRTGGKPGRMILAKKRGVWQ